MFLKRLSTALCVLTCFGGFVLGTNPGTVPDANLVGIENSLLAPLAVDFTLNQNSPKCNGDSDGSIVVTITLGTGPFKIEYKKTSSSLYITTVNSTNSFTVPINNLTAGTYDVRVTDLSQTSNNVDVDNITVTDFPVLTLNGIVTNPTCATGSGTIVLNASGGDISNYSYTIKNSSGTTITPDNPNGYEFSSLISGVYSGHVIDANGCPQSKSSLNVVAPQAISPTVTIDPIDCSTGTATIRLSNLPIDNTSYQIKLDGIVSGSITGTNAVISVIASGSHQLTVERGATCPSDNWSYPSNPIVIEPYDNITFDWGANDPNSLSIGCYGVDTFLTVAVDGGKTGTNFNVELFEDGVSVFTQSSVPAGQNITLPIIKPNLTYSIVATDAVNVSCSSNPFNFTVSAPSNPFVISNVIPTNVTCSGNVDGKATVVFSVGTAPFKYSIDNGLTFSSGYLSNDKTITGLAGNRSYNIVLKDANGCESNFFNVQINEPSPLSITVLTALTKQISCVGVNNASITVQAGGGNGNFLYTLENDGVTILNNVPAQAQREFTNLGSGAYTITVSDGVCVTTASAIEAIDNVLPIEFSHFPVPLAGGGPKCRDEEFDYYIQASNGIFDKPFTYSLYIDGTFVQSFTESSYLQGVPIKIVPGNYYVGVSYDNFCDTVYFPMNIPNPQLFRVSYPDTIYLDCYGDLGSVKVTASGEYAFSYSLDGGSFEPFANQGGTTITGLNGGNHSVLFRDSKGCEYNNGIPVSIYVDEPLEIGVNLLTTAPKASCAGGEAEVTLEVTGGTPPFKVEVIGSGKPAKNTDLNGLVVFNIPDGNGTDYDVLVTDIDKISCDKTIPALFSVIEPLPFVISNIIINKEELSCFGDSTLVEVQTDGGWGGNIIINVKGGTINKNLPPSGLIFLKAGAYTFQATDLTNSCVSLPVSKTITQPNRLVMNIVNHKNVSCNGADDAEIGIGVTGGTQPYFWGVNNAPSNQFNGNSYTITSTDIPLEQGTYNVQVADANGCLSAIKPVNITEPNPITFDFAFDSVTCNGLANASITILNARGGSNTGYQTYLTPNSTGVEVQRTYPVIGGLKTDDYSLRITDGTGVCSSVPVMVNIFEPSAITFIPANFEVDPIKCYNDNNGRIKVDAQGGLPYNLQYKITGKNYQISNEFTGLAPGPYDVWVRNERGNCEQLYPLKLQVIDAEELKATVVITDVVCHNEQNGTIKINATGGTGNLTYYLTNAPGTVANNPNSNGIFTGLGEVNKNATSYNYLVEDQNLCTEPGTFTIANPEELVILLDAKTDVVCNNEKNGTISLKVTGGTVTSGYTFNDFVNGTLNYNIETISDGNYKISSLGTNSPVAFYQPIVTDNNGCKDTLTPQVEIINPEKVAITLVDPGFKMCHGDMNDTTVIYATGGLGMFYYSLDDGDTYSVLSDSVFIGEATGTKYPMVKDENNCTASYASYEYEEPDPLKVFYQFFPIRCYDDVNADMELKIMGGTGDYSLSINDPNFATGVTPIQNINSDTTKFELLKNNVLLVEDTRYRFYLRDENNCHVENIAEVNNFSKQFADTIFTKPKKLVLIADSLTMKRVTCSADQNGIIRFAAEGGTVTAKKGYTLMAKNVKMDFESVNKPFSNYIENLFAGLHHVYLTDANGCIGETRLTDDGYTHDTITVGYSNLSLRANVSEIKLPGCDDTYDGNLEIDIEDFTEDGVIAYVAYLDTTLGLLYSFDEDDSIASNPAFISTSGLYYLNNIDIAQGLGIGTYRITVKDIYTECESYIDTTILSINGDSCPPTFYYNVFTPHNNDEFYEDWTVFGSQHQKYRLQIYTSYGELIYTDKGIADGEGVKWNGVDNKNRPVPVGTYIYLLRKNEGTERDTLINGNVTIIRGDGR